MGVAELIEQQRGRATDRPPFKVADISLAEFGRKEIRLAEQEMPGLMSIRDEYKGKKPLAGARIIFEPEHWPVWKRRNHALSLSSR